MTIKLYNSLSRELEEFRPGSAVKFYTCGVTPYDTTHLGHAFTYIVSDILIRTLESGGHEVIYVQNVTDIDDDILAKARDEQADWRALGDRWTRHYIEDMSALNVRPPDHFPRATGVIPDIVEVVEGLLQAGVAYEAGGSVYFGIDSWPDYGRLSGLSKEEMLPIANQRGNHPDDPNKRDPLDFVLWQAQAPGEPAWPSPWGAGRPGWHIECSTMATKLLGDSIDIHSGGDDLLFPHHESEIAQVEPLTGRPPFSRFWLHVAMVRHEGEKMSKSLGNLVMVRPLLENWPADALRLYLGMHHYREPWSHDEGELARAAGLAARIEQALEANNGKKPALDPGPWRRSFQAALENDLDTPTAFDILAALTNETIAAAHAGKDISEAQKALRASAAVFGLRPGDNRCAAAVAAGWNQHLVQFK